MTTPTPTATEVPFDELRRLEPELDRLAADVRAFVRAPRYCRNGVFLGYEGYGPGFKHRLHALIGWGRSRDRAGSEILFGQQAYRTAYEGLLNLLPPDDLSNNEDPNEDGIMAADVGRLSMPA